ncbi:MAG: type II secretion system protein GspE [Candidatus Harrisonbacteria bacterium CG10_big_fil_rev_8_21_14_0_10_42_17]|uniref:Type II secretion system protein GspE n=1 Tax=Candidatus Harrisonbacteria bacterium CG10_big_fil_rev_8_21_14_0_10_42_17 TaxID=1974584 RepID=A0A2M6WH22_9BACT|nr:MAG: type II secretion system protein GspE [Candidatus Harrisonbacteria bacterium CG10_big_fil_rev_8_21_14_0_10_42_17]
MPDLTAQQQQHQKEVAERIKQSLDGKVDDISIIHIVNDLVENAHEMGASDIHLDPEEGDIRVRFRIDGVLSDFYKLPKELQSEVTTRVKVLAGMRTDEHQAAQDGRFKLSLEDGHKTNIDVRVSIAPTYFGENCVMRLLAQTKGGSITLESLGFSGTNLEKINRAMKRPFGLILATGPTGSGKTTTLYSIMQKLNTPDVSIITIEDPIEYSIEGIDQIQVNQRTGLTFAEGLRFILRQDPDTIMVGEIRDNETSGIAVNAAMTGHLVLSTLHTNDAATTLPRLLDMGVEPFLIASTVNIAIGQRLVRTICSACKVERNLKPEEIEAMKKTMSGEFVEASKSSYFGMGCEKCGKTGFQGRIGIHEVLIITEELRTMIMERATASEIKEKAIEQGMVPMMQDGLEKVKRGITTAEEVLRVFYE